jgi:hypothetical protein
MLESSSLLIAVGPQSPASDHAETRRLILEASRRSPAGFAWRPPENKLSWWPGLFRKSPIVQVHEIVDESLLASLRPANVWSRRWDVLDADGNVVGIIDSRRSDTLVGPAMATAHAAVATPWARRGLRIFLRVGFPGQSQQKFVALTGSNGAAELELGDLDTTDDGLLLRFADQIEAEPFLKLLLLAMTLLVSEEMVSRAE